MSGFRSSQVYEIDEDDSQHLQYDQGEDDEYNQNSNAMKRSSLTTPGTKRPSSSSSRRSNATPLPSSSSANSQQLVPSSTSSTRHARAYSSIDPSEAHKNFKVVIRIRPPLPRELDGMRNVAGQAMYRDIIRTEERNRAVSICENGLPSKGESNPVTDNTGIYATHKFTFDYVFDQDAQQADVYNNTARDAVLSTLQGYNATILAYGQTGTGKTFTMEGYDDVELRGIIPRSVEEIFNYIQNTAHTNVRFLVRASYLQIYNEVISDLLKPERSNLAIREDKKRGVFVEGLSEWVVRSPKEVYGLIKRGTSLRATGSTRINETSSRSHALFIIIVEQNEMIYEQDGSGANDGNTSLSHENRDEMNEQEKVHALAGGAALVRQSFKVGKLNLVDLAGSERVRISGAKGRRLEESRYINQSLSALGNVISALTEGNRQHIPYRDSKLTRILEAALGGNSKTLMIANVGPAQESFLESLSTLKFANRAKNIKNEAKINEDLDEKALLRRYERELKKLRQELQAKSKNVVDKRKLIEVEEQRRRAEQDKMTALMNMERLSRDLLQEKNQKKKLEERIKEMNSQLLIGGHLTNNGAAGAGASNPNDPTAIVESQKAFQQALQLEQDRIRQQYSEKLQELEREREQMEEEKAQTSRYKQLLLKQRDIMIQLTARLNERDQSILLLQEELDAYDKHQRAMEDELDQKRHRLIQLQRMNVGANGAAAGSAAAAGGADGAPTTGADPSSPSHGQQANNLYGLFPIDEAPYFEEHSLSPMHSPSHISAANANAQLNSPPRDAAASAAAASSNPLSFPPGTPAAVDATAMENEIARRVALEVAKFKDQSSSLSMSQPNNTISPVAAAQISELSDHLSRKESEALRLREELERIRSSQSASSSSTSEIASLSAALKAKEEYVANLSVQNANLLQNVTALQMLLQSEKAQAQLAQQQQAASITSPTSGAANTEENKALKENLNSLRKKYDVQLQERAALKVILEKKMKALIDSIANAALHGQAPKSSSLNPSASPGNPNALRDALPSRTKREIEVLQRLVEASLTALKNSDSSAEGAPAGGVGAAEVASGTPSSSPPAISRSFANTSTATSGLPPSALSASTRPVTGSTNPLSSSLPRASAADAASSQLDGIELLIQQRKAELQRLDERLR